MSTNNQKEIFTQSKQRAKQSKKDKVLADGKISLWEIILYARYFLPILTSVAWLIVLIFNPAKDSTLETATITLCVIGWVSALAVSPLKILKFIITCVKTGFKLVRGFIPYYGISDIIGAVVGAGAGLVLAAIVLCIAPAMFTIPKFFHDKKL